MQPQPSPPTYSIGVGSQILASTEGTPHMLGISEASGADPLHPSPPAVAAEAASPIRSRPPPPPSFDDELLPSGFPDEEEAERGGAPGNRWPRQETLALLKIRSEMDAAFREATFKGPLWEEVSRKLAALGYKRGAKKCKEKFENVRKYYKRTKEARAGRQDAKNYRFFSQLEALHSSTGGGPTPAAALAPPTSIAFTSATLGPPAATIQALPLCVMPPSANAIPSTAVSWSSYSSPSESNDEGAEQPRVNGEGRKRKRRAGGGRWMMTFFEGLTKRVMERQEEMQRRFLKAIEQREEDRTIREEAWRRHELALRSREQELLAQDRAMAAARDAALISYLRKIGGAQATPKSPTIPAVVAVSVAPLPPLAPSQLPPPPPPQPPQLQSAPPKLESEGHVSGSLESPPSLRWPKAEVHALIKMRSGLEARYQESGLKGQLWEEIAAGMRQVGYKRSAKRCKEKWENINKYFKKVKDGSKPRAEDGKTCPYFHQLDALYRERQLGTVPAAAVEPIQAEEKANVSSNNGDGGADCVQITSNGDHQPRFSEEGTTKPEEAVQVRKEEMQSQKEIMNDDDGAKMEELESNTLDQLDEEVDEDEDESSNTQYKIQFQQQKVNEGGGGENASTAAVAT